MTGQSEVSTGQGVTPKNYSTWCGDCSAEITQPCLNKLTGLPIKGIHPQRQKALASLKKKGKRDLQLVPKFTEGDRLLKPKDDKPKVVRANLVVAPVYAANRQAPEGGTAHYEWIVRNFVRCTLCSVPIGQHCVTPRGKQLMGVHHHRLMELKERFESGDWDAQLGIAPPPDIKKQATWAEDDQTILEHGARIKRVRGLISVLIEVAGWERTLDHIAERLVEHDVDRKILREV